MSSTCCSRMHWASAVAAAALLAYVVWSVHPARAGARGPRRDATGGPERREIFAYLTRGEVARIEAGRTRFPGDDWSAEDDASREESNTARGIAATFGMALEQIYASLDDGVREHWVVDAAKPRATVAPLRPRTR